MLILEKDAAYPFMMRYYNADGGEAALCGNGARCVGLYAFAEGIAARSFSFRSRSGIHAVSILKNGSVRVSLPACIFHKPNKVTIKGKPFHYEYVTIGVPHIVIFSAHLASIDVRVIGKRIRNLKRFRPQGTNVNFAKMLPSNTLQVRTYERGVEDETLACGTGAAATAAAAFTRGMVSSPVKVITSSGETLIVQLRESGDVLKPSLIGKAHSVFSGTVTIP
jgi:diaminopimelate epimerase